MKRTVCRRPTSDCALLPTMVGVRSALQIQKAVAAHLKSKQLLPFGFAQPQCQSKNILPELPFTHRISCGWKGVALLYNINSLVTSDMPFTGGEYLNS